MSLLTQFYSCGTSSSSGGGGITVDGAYLPGAGVSTIFVDGNYNNPGAGNVLDEGANFRYLSPALSTGNSTDWGGGNVFFDLGDASFVGFNYVSMEVRGLNASQVVESIYLLGSSVDLQAPITGLTKLDGDGIINRINVSSSPSLTSVSTSIVFAGDIFGKSIILTGTALDAASVNHILESAAAYGPKATTIDLSGGTAAGTSLLTAAGTAALTALTAGGATVTLNP